ncbi:uncharacterized protein F4822DRAFT_420123 [Hypoxylon trugodes]|uniref:uncharacterized protein n=1 Tax=Hypoxylon trugodes TaxID=326681 RepID=UPI00219BF725|nr:uncharacterized protein F4822DRAFT_420123 [Hypoxylon trugodes]KAI1383307.1 hypothetical protein F4822DRAFT_420123 [Hypoxylon trugodes]
MEAQPQSVAAPAPSAHSPATDPARIISPVHPTPNPVTHYPNGLPRSINGLKSNATNGSGSASPVTGTGTGTPGATTPAHVTARSPTGIARTISPATTTSTSTSVPASAPAPILPSLPPIAAAPLKPMVIYTPSMSQSPQTATQPRQPLQRQSSSGSSHKISIVDPPGSYSRSKSSSHPSSQGFPSPRREHHLENPKFLDDQSRLTHAMQQSVPAAVRRVIRDNWEKCLLGSEFHHAFLLNAVIHHSNGVIIRRSIKDFGAKMVAESKHEIISHLSTSDLDELAEDILEKCSDYFLDQAVERRLRTIDARSLINALARAERLGYENSDIIEEDRSKTSKFNPAPTFDPSPNPIQNEPSQRLQHRPSLPSLSQSRGPPTVLQCPLCWRKFDSTQPYEYHVQKQVCTKEPPNQQGFPFSCKYCGAGFITKVGQQYHLANHVCGDHGTMPATPRGPANAGSPITLSSGNNSPIQPSSTLPHPLGTQHQFAALSQHAATPTQARIAPMGTPNSHSKEQDPYSHLNPNTLERLNEELRQAEATYTARFKEAEEIQDPAQRQLKLDGLQNSFSTKQSIIRKKYGVRLRNRRTRAEIDNERQRMGWKHNSPGQPEGTPSAKRQRTDDGPPQIKTEVPSNVIPNTVPSAASLPSRPQSNHLAVSDMNAGLGGSSATAATADPTHNPLISTSPRQISQQQNPKQASPQPQEPTQNSISTLQKKGYRVSSHHPASSRVSPVDTTMVDSPHVNNSASAPIVVNDEEDSTDTDSDEEGIPASLPLPGVSNTPSRGMAG